MLSLLVTTLHYLYHDYVVGSPGFPRHQLLQRRRMAKEGSRVRGLMRRRRAAPGARRSSCLVQPSTCQVRKPVLRHSTASVQPGPLRGCLLPQAHPRPH
jgi:hypothetical protein